MKKSQEKDAVLALISTLTVVFVVLFFSLTYFITLRENVQREEARVWQELQALGNSAPARVQPAVAGYETDYTLDE